MERTIKTGVLVLFISFLCIACVRRTPESILMQQFSITLKGFNYNVETFEEEWCPNGDGYVLIVFKFKELTQENISYFQSKRLKKLPMLSNEIIPTRFLYNKGYYIFENYNKDDERDFKLFVVDTENNKAILYYQFM